MRSREIREEIYHFLQREIEIHREVLGQPKVEVEPEPPRDLRNPVPRRIPRKKTKSRRGKVIEFFSFFGVAGLIFSALFLTVNFSAFAQLAQLRINPEVTAKKEFALKETLENKISADIFNTKNNDQFSFAIAPLQNVVVIPKIGKSIPIVKVSSRGLLSENWDILEKDIQNGLKTGVVHYPGTAIPGQNGNVFITGHSSFYPWFSGKFGDAFAPLHDLKIGDEFSVFWSQKKFNYQIREIKVVDPEDVSVLSQPKNRRLATLMTCTPIGTTKKRLILIAEEI